MRPCGYVLIILGGLAFLLSIAGEYTLSPHPHIIALLIAGLTNPWFFVGVPLGVYWIRRGSSSTRANDGPIPTTDPDSLLVKPDGSSPTRVNDGSIPPVEQATPTIANSITTDSAPTGNSAALVVFCVVAFFGALGVMLAILNSGTASNRKGDFYKHIADYKGDFDKAIADYSEAIRLDPTDAIAYFNRGNDWLNKKHFDKAIADYNQAIRLNPTDADAYFNRGLIWEYKKEYDKANGDYSEAIRLDPQLSAAYNNRGNAVRGSR